MHNHETKKYFLLYISNNSMQKRKWKMKKNEKQITRRQRVYVSLQRNLQDDKKASLW